MKTYTIDEATAALPKIAKEAYDEEPVVLVDGPRLLVLRPYDPPVTPWVPPPGYYDGLYTPEEVEWENRVAEESFRHAGELGITERVFHRSSTVIY